jgi:hypothetical protein
VSVAARFHAGFARRLGHPTAWRGRLRPVDTVLAALREAGFNLDEHRRVGPGGHAPHVLVTNQVA